MRCMQARAGSQGYPARDVHRPKMVMGMQIKDSFRFDRFRSWGDRKSVV